MSINPFKWKLLCRTFLCCYILRCTRWFFGWYPIKSCRELVSCGVVYSFEQDGTPVWVGIQMKAIYAVAKMLKRKFINWVWKKIDYTIVLLLCIVISTERLCIHHSGSWLNTNSVKLFTLKENQIFKAISKYEHRFCKWLIAAVKFLIYQNFDPTR